MRSTMFWIGVAFVAVMIAVLFGDTGGPVPDTVRPEAAFVGADWSTPHPEIVAILEGEKNESAEPEVIEPAPSAGLETARSAPVVTDAGAGTREAPPSECALADAIRAAWAGTGDEEWAVSVAWRESRCGPGARNASGASGIFQLMMPMHRALVAHICGEPADELVFDADCNIRAARALYDGSGRRPWNF